MPTLTAQEMLAAYMAAELALLQGGKSVRFNDGNVDRMLTREDLEWIQKGRREWEARVSAAARIASGAPTFGGLGFSVARLDGR
jgi:hypothetical protein